MAFLYPLCRDLESFLGVLYFENRQGKDDRLSFTRGRAILVGHLSFSSSRSETNDATRESEVLRFRRSENSALLSRKMG